MQKEVNMAENIKVNELEIGARLRDEDRLLVLVDDVNNEVKTIAKENVVTSLISTVENNLLANNGGLFVDGNAINELLETLKLIKERQADEIGRPIPTFSNTLLDDEIWLEGATVSREEYAQLFEIYGETYGAGDGSTTFKLPDCRNRVFWGASNFGYLDATSPNITGQIVESNDLNYYPNLFTGAFKHMGVSSAGRCANDRDGSTVSVISFDASRSSSIYQDGATVRPPAIKVRVKTRFK